MIKWLLLYLLLGGGLVYSSTPADSLIRIRDSLVVELKRAPDGDYVRSKMLSDRIDAIEKRLTPGQSRHPASTAAAPEDLFQLEARQSVLKARIKRNVTLRDSLLGALTELHFNDEAAESFRETRGNVGGDPREKNRPERMDLNPDIENRKAAIVERIDSLKVEIKTLSRQVESNKALIQSQLKGGQP